MLSRSIVLILFIVHWNVERVWSGGGHSKKNNSAVVAGSELIFAQILFRNGDRTPVQTYKNDPFGGPEHWESGPGELTSIGKQDLLALGKFLRKRYANLLNNRTYSSDLIYVRSSYLNRAKESATAAMSGFFDHAKWNDSLPSIPINVVPEETDNIISFFSVKCPAYDVKELRDQIPKYKELFDYLSEHTGKKSMNLLRAYRVFYALNVEKLKGFNLDEKAPWTKRVLTGNFSKLKHEAEKDYFTAFFSTKLRAKLMSGFMLREMLDRFDAKSKSELRPDYSFYVYSGHDSNVFGLLNSLKVVDDVFPPYGACVLFELYKSAKGEYYVQLFYKNTAAEVLNPLKIPGCDVKCSLAKIRTLERVKEILPTKDFATECNAKAKPKAKAKAK